MENIEKFAIERMGNDSSGHDYFHALRVRNNALKLAKAEGNCDLDVVIAAALLHDVPDPKLCKDIKQATDDCVKVMLENGLTKEQCDHVIHIISHLSFKGASISTDMDTIEGKVVQDADRLDAIGAIGVARCFAFGGSHNRVLWNPDEAPASYKTESEYRNTKSSTLNHFDEKLLLLKDLMQTESGKKVAQKRHDYIAEFKNRFIDEWYGRDMDDTL